MIGFGLVAKYFITPNGRSLFYYLGFPTKTLRWREFIAHLENAHKRRMIKKRIVNEVIL